MSEIEDLKLPTSKNEGNYSSSNSFIIENKIGKGQFSIVYKAISTSDKREIALKKIPIAEMTNEQSLLDCLKEVNLLQQLSHPNIIRYISSFIEMNELHIVLELADGGDLAGLISYAKKKKLLIAENAIWKYFAQITKALQHMHEKRIMHRDIKPANVFLTKDGVIKLGDLGLGRYMSNRTHAAHSLVGTPYYMAPERINERGYNFKSDIWSLGCLLYELAALQSPFYGDKMNFYTLCKKIEVSDYPPIPCSLYSQQCRTLVASCLRSDPSTRPDINYINNVAQGMNELFQSLAMKL